MASMEFEVDADDDSCANNEASYYVDLHREEFDWCFDTIQNTETKKFL